MPFIALYSDKDFFSVSRSRFFKPAMYKKIIGLGRHMQFVHNIKLYRTCCNNATVFVAKISQVIVQE